jgi:hypothetical protein
MTSPSAVTPVSPRATNRMTYPVRTAPVTALIAQAE